MFVVKCYGALQGGVTEYITVGEIFGYNARTWLVFLRDIMFITGGFFVVGTGQVAETGGRGDRDLGGAELGVVKEEGCLCSAVKAISSSLRKN